MIKNNHYRNISYNRIDFVLMLPIILNINIPNYIHIANNITSFTNVVVTFKQAFLQPYKFYAFQPPPKKKKNLVLILLIY